MANLGDNRRTEMKQILLNICRKIMDATPRTIEIINTKPINSLRVVSRNAKNTKDPNPLQTTLSTMSTKYPLSVETSMVDKYQIPDEFINRKMQDTHQHGRTLARMEIIDWWIENSKIPDEDTTNVIDIIRKQPRKEVSLYNNIDWNMTCVRFRPVVLERRHTKQKYPLMNLSKDMREAAIMQTLAPSYVTPHTMVPSHVLRELKDLADASLSRKIMFSQQVRILASQLNPQYRFTPSIPQSDDITGPLRHAICQSTWCILNYKIPPDEKSLENGKIVNSLGISTVQALKAHPNDWHLIHDQLLATKVNGVSLR